MQSGQSSTLIFVQNCASQSDFRNRLLGFDHLPRRHGGTEERGLEPPINANQHEGGIRKAARSGQEAKTPHLALLPANCCHSRFFALIRCLAPVFLCVSVSPWLMLRW